MNPSSTALQPRLAGIVTGPCDDIKQNQTIAAAAKGEYGLHLVGLNREFLRLSTVCI